MSDMTEQLRSLAKSNTRREEGEDWRDKIEWQAADTIDRMASAIADDNKEMRRLNDEIDRLTRELAEARDKALEDAAKALDAWGDIYGDNAAKTVRALKEKP